MGAAGFQAEFSDLLQACNNPAGLHDAALNDKSKTPINIKIHPGEMLLSSHPRMFLNYSFGRWMLSDIRNKIFRAVAQLSDRCALS